MAETRDNRTARPEKGLKASGQATDDLVRSALARLYLYEIKGVGEKPGFCGSS
ncbi:MAG: hypothetical protein KKA60_15430 [Proteobacteria bacterium]|nr:hypothetical protein [Pseudomonadota bacterium]